LTPSRLTVPLAAGPSIKVSLTLGWTTTTLRFGTFAMT
jgi:hypothetical protein